MGIARDEIGIQMLCAWNNIPREAALPDWSSHHNAATREAWARVAEAAIRSIREPSDAMIAASGVALVEYIDSLPPKKATWRVTAETKARVRFIAMIDTALALLSSTPPSTVVPGAGK